MNTEQRIVRLLVGGPAAATLGMQALCAISVGDLLAYRVGVLLLSIGLLAWIWRSKDIVIGPLVPRLAFCLVAAASFSLSLLETLLLRGPVFARGVLGLIAAASIYATLLLALTRPRARDSFAGWLVVHLGLAVSAVVVALAAVEATFHATTPANLYEIVPDDPRSAPCIIRQPVLGWQLRPGFRGRYLHPEFPGSRVDINDLGFRDGLEETAPPLPGHASVLGARRLARLRDGCRA